jgi:hypothetical protein
MKTLEEAVTAAMDILLPFLPFRKTVSGINNTAP